MTSFGLSWALSPSFYPRRSSSWYWQDAKFGTIANVIILLVAILAYAGWSFEDSYREDVKATLERTNAMESELITEAACSLCRRRCRSTCGMLE